MKNRETMQDRLFMFFVYAILILFSLIVAYPIYFMCIASVSDPNAVMRGEVIFWLKNFTLLGYERIFSNDTIFVSYGNSILYTITGVIISLVMTIPTAFALSRRELPGGSIITKLFVFTMYFYGGMIPTYLVVKQVGLLNNMFSLILPTAIVTYNLVVARSFYVNAIPDELYLFAGWLHLYALFLLDRAAAVQIHHCGHGAVLHHQNVERIHGRAHVSERRG